MTAPDHDSAGAVAPVRTRQWLPLAAQGVTTACAVATLLAAAARSAWIADLATHFRWQYVVASALAAFVLAWHRHAAWAAIGGLLAAVNLYAAWPAGPPQIPARASSAAAVRVLVSNVFLANDDHARVLALVHEKEPDIAVFAEVTPGWRAALRALDSELPHARFASGGRHGVLVMSRRPVLAWRTIALAPESVPFVHAVIEVSGRSIDFYGVHANWPLGGRSSAIRNLQLRQLAGFARNANGPTIIAGDLNVTRHSPHFADLLADGGLEPAAQGAWTMTWPAFFPPAGIQIDHVLVSRHLAPSGFEIGPHVGSDHRPVTVELQLLPAPPPP
jgi:endonuclease/exonuclease/phosphatase (EEP) superfamily protein YafD